MTAVAEIDAHINKITEGVSDRVVKLTNIDSAVGQLDSVTQKNAAMVEQSKAASQVLSTDAKELSE